MTPEFPDVNEIVMIASLCAQIILENGGETYRAEETVCRICNAFGFDGTEVVAIPTGVFISVSSCGVSEGSAIKRIRKRSFNLEAIEKVNSIARSLTEGKIKASDALKQLYAIYNEKPGNKYIPVLATGLSSGFFALVFRGNLFDFAAAALCGAIVQLASGFIKTKDTYNFTVSLLGGFLISLVTVLWVKLTNTGNIDKIIIGALMPLLPGIPMTNAIRDTMRGDLLSGVARAAEALLISVALAFGVGLVLVIYFKI